MYILKNALRNILRSKGRNILIGIIVLAIATSSCVALSIKQAAVTARNEALSGIKITAQISVDRRKLMEKNSGDRENMREIMQNIENLSIEDLQKYAQADCVEDFYYTLTTAMNASGKLEAVDTTGIERDEDEDTSSTTSTSKTSANSSITVKNMSTSANSLGGIIIKQTNTDETASLGTSSEATESEQEISSEATESEQETSSEATQENTSSEEVTSIPQNDNQMGGNMPNRGDRDDDFQNSQWGDTQRGDNAQQEMPDFSDSDSNKQNFGGNSQSGGRGSNSGNYGNSGNFANGNTGGMMQGGAVDRDRFMAGIMGMQGDFTVVGYSSLSAMTDFTTGTKQITDGEIFDVTTEDKVCIISSELATYNELKVGDKIKLQNPNNEGETYKFTIVGIYTDSESGATDSSQMSGFSTAQDSANQIYTTYPALKKITTKSIKNETVEEEEDTGRTASSALREQENGTYVFANIDDYDKFEAQAKELGLSDEYTISSTDVSSFEAKITPLENLGDFATYFLIIVLAIGAIILGVLNIFNIRERKYEIGVLAAIGMKKFKISMQFLTEIFIVTFIALIIGTGIGASVSVPVTNTLLERQITTSQSAENQQNRNFGRENGNAMQQPPTDRGGFIGSSTNYISSVTSATNFTVVLQLMLVGIILTIAAGCVAIISVLRYDPLKILTMRD